MRRSSSEVSGVPLIVERAAPYAEIFSSKGNGSDVVLAGVVMIFEFLPLNFRAVMIALIRCGPGDILDSARRGYVS